MNCACGQFQEEERQPFPKRIRHEILLFLTGGVLYAVIEILWRGHTHWTMGVTGGICFVLVGLINQRCPKCLSLVSQMAFSALIITGIEFLTGTVVNVVFGLAVWDYSEMPYNVFGQICLVYSNLWFLLSLPAILLDDWLRYWWFGGIRPTYRIF